MPETRLFSLTLERAYSGLQNCLSMYAIFVRQQGMKLEFSTSQAIVSFITKPKKMTVVFTTMALIK